MGTERAVTDDQVLDALATGASLLDVAYNLYVDRTTISNYIRRLRADGINIPNTAKHRKGVLGYRLSHK